MSDVQLPIRIDKQLKIDFIKCCKEQDSTASQEIRKFIKDYLKKNSQRKLAL